MINKIFLPVILFVLFFNIQYSFSKSLKEDRISKKEHSQKMLEIFDGLCLQNTENFRNIDRMAKFMNFKKLPDSYKNGDLAFYQKGGSMYGGLYEGDLFMAGYVNRGGCTIASKSFNAKGLIEKINNNYKVRLLDKTEEGIQIQEFFILERGSLYEGGLISVTYGKKNFDSGVGSVGYLPRKIMEQNKNIQ